jgi:hypothetical protein
MTTLGHANVVVTQNAGFTRTGYRRIKKLSNAVPSF